MTSSGPPWGTAQRAWEQNLRRQFQGVALQPEVAQWRASWGNECYINNPSKTQMHVKHTSTNTNTSLAQAHLGWSSKLKDGEKVGQIVPEQNPWLRYDVFFCCCKNSKGKKIKQEIMIAKFFSSNRTRILTKHVPENVASDADGVEALPRPRASLLHRLHRRHEHNVKSCGVLTT